MAILITGCVVEDEIDRINPITGKMELYERRRTRKLPNLGAVMAALVNCSKPGDEINWQSINKVENTINNHSTEEKPTIQFTKKRNVDTPES